MEIKYAKQPNIIYGVLSIALAAIPFVRQDPEFSNAVAFKICYAGLFALGSIYFFYKGLNNKPVYIIKPDEIVLCKSNTTYKISELAYYKEHVYRLKFSSQQYVNFYDANKKFAFNLQINGTNCTTKQVIDLVKGKLRAY